jgi:hypothetical protein
MRHAWGGYLAHAWPEDELAPLSKVGVEWLNVGLTIVDALDTLLIMGLDEEVEEARAWITSDALTFDADKNANVFESTIRIIGGLTASHALGGDTVGGGLLNKALDLAERLAPAFMTKTGIPIMDVNFQSGLPHQPSWTQKSSLSEAGTLVLEWEALEEALGRAENSSTACGGGGSGESGSGGFSLDGGCQLSITQPIRGSSGGEGWDGGGDRSDDRSDNGSDNGIDDNGSDDNTSGSGIDSVGVGDNEQCGSECDKEEGDAEGEATADDSSVACGGGGSGESGSGGVSLDSDCQLSVTQPIRSSSGGGGCESYEYTFVPEVGFIKVPKCEPAPAMAHSTLAAMTGRTYRRDIAEGARRAFAAVSDAVWQIPNDGLVPIAVNADDAQFDPASVLTLGARGDSFYEYLLKHWLHSGKPAGGEAAYLRAMDGVLLHLLHRSSKGSAGDTGIGAPEADAVVGGGSGGNVGADDAEAGVGAREGGIIGKGARRRRWYSSVNDKDEGSSRSHESGGGGSGGGRGADATPTGATSANSNSKGLLYVAEREGGVGGRAVHKMDHLVCFLPGLLALGHSEGLGRRWGGGDRIREHQAVRALLRLGMPTHATHLDVARQLARTCVQMYARTPAGLAPEITHFPASGLAKRKADGGLVATSSGLSVFGDVLIKDKDAHNLLRPETVESLWVLWRVTGEHEWRDAGWRMWQAWERHARVESGGYASLKSVTVTERGGFERSDKMESFFLAETLKYLYLLFSDDPALLPLPCFVFNTEAHPLPVLTRGASDGGACVERVVKENIEKLAALHGL